VWPSTVLWRASLILKMSVVSDMKPCDTS
jgi:hypothetical protein